MKVVTRLIPIVFLLAGSNLARSTETEVDINFSAGNDSNPFRLAEQFEPEAGSYIDFGLEYDAEFKYGFYIDAEKSFRTFEKDVENANLDEFDLDLGWEKKFKKKHTVNLEASIRNYDKTYIARSTGLTGTFGGTPIPNRYDYDWQRFTGEYEFRLNKRHRLLFEIDQLDKDYFDYTSLGLSNLDYQHLGIETRWIYRFAKGWSFDAYYRYRAREYDDRRARDLNGNTIADSNLEYRYNWINGMFVYRLNKQHRFRFRAYYVDKKDNFSGYYDTELTSVEANWRWYTFIKSRMYVSLRYRDYKNNNIIPDEEFEEEVNTNDNDGFIFSFSYNHPIKASRNATLDGYVRASLYDIKAPQAIYEYDRNILEIGLEMKF